MKKPKPCIRLGAIENTGEMEKALAWDDNQFGFS